MLRTEIEANGTMTEGLGREDDDLGKSRAGLFRGAVSVRGVRVGRETSGVGAQ